MSLQSCSLAGESFGSPPVSAEAHQSSQGQGGYFDAKHLKQEAVRIWDVSKTATIQLELDWSGLNHLINSSH